MNEAVPIIEPDGLPDVWLARIKPELAPGERLVWAGQARRPRGLSGLSFATIYAIGFAIISAVGLAGLFGPLAGRLQFLENWLATMGVGGGIAAFLTGIGVVAHAIDGRKERKQIAGNLYALTESRAIVWSPSGRGVAVHSIPRGTVKRVRRVEYADGFGTVLFDDMTPGLTTIEQGFHEIPDARRVEALVRLHLIGDDRSPSA